MHTYSPDETNVSLVRTMPDLTGWTLEALLTEYGALAIRQRDAVAASVTAEDDGTVRQVEDDLARVADEIERRATR